MKENEVMELIKKATAIKDLGMDEQIESLLQLNVLSTLDKTFKGGVGDIAELASANTPRRIIKILKKYKKI